MAKFALVHIALLSFASSALSLTVNDLLGFGYLRQSRPEEPRVVEVLRWRQSVCLTAAPGILPCLVGLENAQPSQQVQEQYSHGSSYQSKQHLQDEKEADDHLLKTLTKDDSALDSGSLESDEEDLFPKNRPGRATPALKLYSPRVVRLAKLENMGPSTLGDARQGARRGRYLRLGPGVGSGRRQTVYVTKVVDSPVVATLVASTCLPDIGIPLCDEIQHPQQSSGASHYQTQQPNSEISQYQAPQYQPSPAPAHYQSQQPQQNPPPSHYQVQQPQQNPPPAYYQVQPQQQNPAASHYQIQQLQQNPAPAPYEVQYPQQVPGGSQYYQYAGAQQVPNPSLVYNGPPIQGPPAPSQPSSTVAPNIIQNIADFLTGPQVVQANQTPEVKPVVVYQQPPPPGIFDGINAFLMPNGSWFGIFNFNGSQPGFPGIQLPQLPPLPQVPNLQDILYRPENEISQPPNILNIFNLTNNQNQPGAGPPTQSPGIFGGLFAAPNRPQGVTYPQPTTTTTTTTTTPQPSILDGINNIFRPTSRPLVIESPDNKPIVIERPIYVAEQPVIPGIFDIFQNQNRPVHVNSNEEPWVIKEPVYVLQRPNEAPQIFGVQLPNFNIFGSSSTTSTTTTTPQPWPQGFPNPPRAIPEVVPADSDTILETDSQPLENPKSGVYASYGVTSTPVHTSTPSSSYAGVSSEESPESLETNVGEIGLLEESLQEIADAEGRPETTGIAEENYEVEDVLKNSELSDNQEQLGYKKIEEQVDNEA